MSKMRKYWHSKRGGLHRARQDRPNHGDDTLELRGEVLRLDGKLTEKQNTEWQDELRLRNAVYTGTFLPTLNQIKTRLESEHAKALEDLQARHRAEIDGTMALVADMRALVEDGRNLIADWIEVFDMERGSSGKYLFSTDVRALFADYDQLRTEHAAMARELKPLGRAVTERNRGRPIAASEAQIERVRTLRKAKRSLRAIVADTGLSLRTVRTILADRPAKQAVQRNREIDRLRQAEWRVRKRDFDASAQAGHRPTGRSGQALEDRQGPVIAF
jgi:hypothetical protein